VSFLAELRRRKVFRVAVVYAATAFVVLQAAELLTAGLRLPDWVFPTVTVLLVLGLPLALVLGWALELTPEGLRVTTAAATAAGTPPPSLLGRRTLLVAGALVLIGTGLGAGLLLGPAQGADPAAGDPAADGGAALERSVAVLPFTDLSEGGDQKWFADGLAEEILSSLARLPELRVSGRNSSFLMADGAADDREIARTLDVAHLVKGSVRRVGDQLRVTAQLVRAADGLQLWSESYDRGAASLLEVQRDVAEKVAAALDVLLDEKRRQQMFAAGTRSVEAFEAYLRGLELFAAAHRAGSGVTLAEANPWLERAMALDPGFAAPAFRHADRYGHLVVDGPGTWIVGPHQLTVAQALDRLRADLAHVERVRDHQARALAAISRTLFSTDWRMLPSLVDDLEAHAAVPVTDDLWGSLAPFALGRLDLARARAAALAQRDPLTETGWLLGIHAALADGDVPGARRLIAESRNTLASHRALDERALMAAVLAGERDSALARLTPAAEQTGYAAALRGERQAALARAAAVAAQAEWPVPQLLLVYHELDEPELGRQLAARIDALPAGPLMLLRELSLAGRTLAFDPADTPNFSARMREAGVDPASLPVLPRLGAGRGKDVVLRVQGAERAGG
jgi:TolB-like protein